MIEISPEADTAFRRAIRETIARSPATAAPRTPQFIPVPMPQQDDGMRALRRLVKSLAKKVEALGSNISNSPMPTKTAESAACSNIVAENFEVGSNPRSNTFDLAFLRKSFDEAKHPRDRTGKWISAGKIEEAKADPAKAAALKKTVSDPVELEKLDAALDEPADHPARVYHDRYSKGDEFTRQQLLKEGAQGHHGDTVQAGVREGIKKHNAAGGMPFSEELHDRVLGAVKPPETDPALDFSMEAMDAPLKADPRSSVETRPRNQEREQLEHRLRAEQAGEADTFKGAGSRPIADVKPVEIPEDHPALQAPAVEHKLPPPIKHTVDRTAALAQSVTGKTGPAKTETLFKLRQALESHTHAELKAIRERIGIRASGTKAEIADKVATRAAVKGRTDRRHFTGPTMTVDEAHDLIRGNDHSDRGGSIKLANKLAGQLTGKQLRELKAKLGVKASGTKWVMAQKIAKRGGYSGQRGRTDVGIPPVADTIPPTPEPDHAEGTGTPAAEPHEPGAGLPDAVAGGNPAGGDLGEAGRGEAGDAPFKPGIRLVRGEHTQPADPAALPQSIAQHLTPDQRHGAALAVKAMKAHGGFLNNDSTGVGKTRQQLAVGQTFAQEGKKVLIVAPKSVTKADFKKGTLSGSFKNDSDAMGIPLTVNDGDSPLSPGQIHVTTYDRLKDIKDKVDKDTVVLMDESHYTKNSDSARSKHAKEMTAAAHSVMYSTATPGDKALHIGHLDRMGIYGTAGKKATLEKLGMELHDQHIGGGKYQKVWRVKPNTTHEEVQRRLGGLFDQATKDGLMIRRELGLNGVEFQSNHVRLTPEQNGEMKSVYDGVMSKTGNKAVSLMAARMHQEHMKIPHQVEAIKRDLAEGRRPVVFASRVNDVDPSGGTYHDEAKDALADLGHSSPGTIPELKRQLLAAGVEAGDIAEMHGDASEKPEKAMARFQNGQAKIMLTTPQSGGTGVNLDDTVGDAPRSVHIMTPPFSANDMAQMIGRVHRLNTKSASKIHAVLSDHEIDHWGASILHDKMKSQGAMTGGTYSDAAGKLLGDKFQVHAAAEPEAKFDWGESLLDTRHYHPVPYAQKDAAAKFGGKPHNTGTRESPQWTTAFPSREHYDRFKSESELKPLPPPTTPKPVAATRAAAHHGGNSHSFTKLKSGDWGARVSANSEAGDTATLTTKAGATKHVKLGRKVWSGGGVSLHEIA